MELEVAKEVAKINKALSHEGRILILSSLGKLGLSDITKQTGLSFQALQRHVKTLLDQGLIKKGEAKGKYELTEDGKYVVKFLEFLTEVPRVVRTKRRIVKEEVEKFLPLIEKAFGAPTTEKLREAIESMKKELKI